MKYDFKSVLLLLGIFTMMLIIFPINTALAIANIDFNGLCNSSILDVSEYVKLFKEDIDDIQTAISHHAMLRPSASGINSVLINEFDIQDIAVSPDGTVVYMTGKGEKLVYRYDVMSGEVTSLAMPNYARMLYVTSGGNILVTIVNTERYTATIGVINADSFSLEATFDVTQSYSSGDLLGVVADDDYIYAYDQHGTYIHNVATYEFVATSYASPYDLETNPATGSIYLVDSGWVESCNVVDDELIINKINDDYNPKSLIIMPDGKHLMLSDGSILTCSANPQEDLIYVTKLETKDNLASLGMQGIVAVNATTNELYISDRRVINVYDASNFSFKRTITEPAIVDYLLCGGGNLFIGQDDKDDNTLIHSVFVGSLLKKLHIDGEPFAEFYPTFLEMDRGEVPNAKTSINIAAAAAQEGSVVSGDIGELPLVVGENIFNITVTEPISGKTETYSIKLIRLESDPPIESFNAFTDLGFTVHDTVLDPDRPVAYMTEVDGKSVYRVDLETGVIQKKEFDIYAKSITVNNGNLYVILHRSNIHSPYIDDGYWNAGAVAVIDTQTFITTDIFELFSYLDDIEVDDDGRVYLYGGTLVIYDSYTYQFLDLQTSGCGLNLILNEQKNKVYGVDDDRLVAFEIESGTIVDYYDWDYNQYNVNNYAQISPDSQYIFTSAGNIFTSSATESDDMRYDGLVGRYTSICFDPVHDMFYTSKGHRMYGYKYSTRQMKHSGTYDDEFLGIFFDGTDIIVVQQKSTGECYVNKISTDGKNADLSDLDVSAGTLSPAFDTNAEEYSLLLDADTKEVTIAPILSDSQASFNINGVSNGSLILSLENGEYSLITVKVISQDGTAVREYKIKVYRQTDDGTFVFNENHILSAKKVAHPDYPAVYMISGAKKTFVYKIDEQGKLAALPLPYEATSVGYAKGIILVAIQDDTFFKKYIAVVNAESFTLIDTFEVDKLYTGFAGDSNYIYMSDDDRIDVFSKNTYNYISSVFLHEPYYMIPNETTGRLYVSSYWGIMSYSIYEGNLTLETGYNESYMTSGMEIMPDGEHIVLRQGRVLKCSSDTAQDLQVVTSITTDRINLPATNASANELYVPCDRLIFVYDASDFSFKRVIAEPRYIDYLLNGEYMFATESYGLENPTMRTVRPEALLKTLLFDDEPFSEFFPMQMQVDKGEVPFAKSSISITATPAVEGAVVTGDTGLQSLDVGENVLEITVTNTDTSESVTYSIKITRRASDPPQTVLNAFDNLKLKPLDIALDPDRPVAYLTGEDRRCLYRIDLETGDVQIKEFELQAERLTVLNGKVYVTLMRHEHIWNTYSEGYGAIAVIDTATFKVQNIVEINTDPYDIEANDFGYIYIAPGSNQGSHLSIYDSQNGNIVQERRIMYQKGYIDYNYQLNKLYYIDQGISPRGIEAFVIVDGICTNDYSWPYFHDYDGVTADLCVSPDGNYIFNGSGWVFSCSPVRDDDMTFYGDIGTSYTSICFDLPNNRFYTSENNTLTIYEYDTMTILDTRVFSNQLVMLKHDGEKIIAVQKDSNGYYINGNLIALDNANLSNIDFTIGNLTPAFDADTLEYDVLVGSIVSETVVNATSEDRAATIRINGEVTTSKSIVLDPGETTDVIIEVTAQDGVSKKEYIIHVERDDLTNADLASILLSTGTLTPDFEPDVTEYQVELPAWIQSVRLDFNKADSGAVVRIGDTIVNLKRVFVDPGETKTITVDVTAPDGITKKTYTIEISRAAVAVAGITLTNTTLELNPNQSSTLTAVISPSDATNQNVTWETNDENVATVEDGLVTAVAPGTATITVTTEDGGFTDTCVVTATQPVTGVGLKWSTLTVYAETESMPLISTVYPENASNKKLSWSSSNSSVATVVNGLVNPLSSGTATITVTTEDGGFTDTCIVTVKERKIESTVYAIDNYYITGIAVNTSVAQLKANLLNNSSDIKIFDSNGAEYTGNAVSTNMKVKFFLEGDCADELTIIILGDANGDGSISITDYTLARLDILGLKALGQTGAAAADINGDGVVSITDYTLMRLDILGLKKIH